MNELAFSVAVMTVEDVPSVLLLWESIPEVRLLEGEDRRSIDKLLSEQRGRSFVARGPGGDLIGAICGGTVGAVGVIRHLAVAEASRGRGIGTALVNACVEALRAADIARIAAFVRPDNPTGTKFWEHLGWSHNQGYVCLEKSLTAGPGRTHE